MKNILIAHGGAPTTVINSSLYGVIKKLKEMKFDGKIMAARYGSKGILAEDFIDLTNVTNKQLELLKCTPGSSIGTSRHPLVESDYMKMAEIFEKHDIGYVLFNGGNGSMDTCGNITKYAKNVLTIGIPKTIDNDILVTDHAPGFPSAARYVAKVAGEMMQDLKGLPIHVSILESMGRNTGWLTAAAGLAGLKSNEGPHLLCFPEIPFEEEKFLVNAEKLYKKHGGVLVVASEGLKDKNGVPIVEPIFKVGRATYFGDVSSHLSNLIIKNLGIKARSEKPGIVGRCSMMYASQIDIDEAILCGEVAVESILGGETGKMVGIKRISTNPYVTETILIPVEEVMLEEKIMPRDFINNEGTGVTEKFIKWIEPLVGDMDEFVSFI